MLRWGCFKVGCFVSYPVRFFFFLEVVGLWGSVASETA